MPVSPPQPDSDLDCQKHTQPSQQSRNQAYLIKCGSDNATAMPDRPNKRTGKTKHITVQQAAFVSYQGIYCFLKMGTDLGAWFFPNGWLKWPKTPYIVFFLLTSNNILVNLIYIDLIGNVCNFTKKTYVNLNLISRDGAMFEQIKKRDGRITSFDSSKITSAIEKAGRATGEFNGREAKRLTLRVLTLARDLQLGSVPEVEEIQDIVERVLLDSPFYKTAKAYIIYREQHNQIRRIAIKQNVDLMEAYISQMDWKVKENSNMSYSLQGLNNYISSDITAEYWLNKIYPPTVRDAHYNGDIHLHDLSLLSVYCVGWDLQDLLLEGFKGVAGKVESSPPRHFRSALGQIVNFFYTLQGEAAGAQAMSNFDTLLAPFVREDKLSTKEVKQALQEFVFNINHPHPVGSRPRSPISPWI